MMEKTMFLCKDSITGRGWDGKGFNSTLRPVPVNDDQRKLLESVFDYVESTKIGTFPNQLSKRNIR